MKAIYEIKKVYKKLSQNNGSSLAEFAVVGALMATLAATAMPKFSAMIEKSKAEKTMKQIDKLLTMAQTYYNVSAEYNNGSSTPFFPGQEKYTMPVGDYGREILPEDFNWYTLGDTLSGWENEIMDDLAQFTRYDHPIGSKWRSVFGLIDGSLEGGGGSYTSINAPEGNKVQDEWWEDCWDCTEDNNPIYGVTGWEHWRWLFNDNSLFSPFQDGHYIYAVVPGGGSGQHYHLPRIVIADLENPRDFHKWLTP